MLFAVCVAAVLACALAGPVYELNLVDALQTRLDKGSSADAVFHDFKTVFNKTYEDEVEEEMRKKIFEINVDYIREHNVLYAKGDKSYTLAVNQFTDLTHKEFLLQYTGLGPVGKPGNGSLFLAPSNVRIPTSVDWRNKGYVTPVKDQGQCGSCWAFSTTGSLEGQVAKATGKLVSLSEQQLVDCSKQNHGCNGGVMDIAFSYIKSVEGLEQEKDYPYTARQGTCRFNKRMVVQSSAVTGHVDILPSGSETSLQQAVATAGPVSIAIDASHPSFQHYRSGVYYEKLCSSRKLDHGVLTVGYGTSPQDYWLVKNSWGSSWGESGYLKMARNKGNNCGVATMASYPLV